jgi:aerobic-type carbon monoxide dehydrogenase small subunit (CoxS/CutS family)
MTMRKTVRLKVNGTSYEKDVEPRMLLSDFLRHELALTGTHVGCEHGVCGACTILLDGAPVRSCLTFAIQVEGKDVRTVESLATNTQIDERKNSMGNVEEARSITDTLSVLQASFWEHQGLQCGFCTPGVLMSMEALLTDNPDPSREEVRDALSGHICRCTGYHDIVDSVMTAAKVRRALANTAASNQDLLRRAFLAE